MNGYLHTGTPSDFGDYVYCGFKWIYLKNPKLNTLYRQDKINPNSSLYNSRRYVAKTAGQRNEDLCVEWVLQEYNLLPEKIIYNGTGKKNYDYVTSSIRGMNISMQCRPDLIVRKDNKNILFEFKAVSEELFAFLEIFDSVYAQVWCYSHLVEIQVDEYNLLKYFVNPLNNPFNSITQITDKVIDDSKFEVLFSNYIKLISMLNHLSLNSKLHDIKKVFKTLNMPSHEEEKKLKCTNCFLKKQNICPIW